MVDIPEELVRHLRGAERVTALTGAGISAESGVPTFRDAQSGLWATYDPQELATPEAFRRNPDLVWEWYAWRRELVGRAAPNAAHRALTVMEEQVPQFALITQNIDNLHQEAGSVEVIELHGNLWRSRCSRENRIVENWDDNGEIPPRCPRCGARLRPDVVWFGEGLPRANLSTALSASHRADVFLSIGTSALVYPAAALPLQAVEHGAVTVEVNPEKTPVTAWMDFVLAGPAGQVLPDLVRSVWSSTHHAKKE